MSGKSYVGINGIARENKKIYVGVNNVAREVKKAYVGVNGVAKEIYSGEEPWGTRTYTFNNYINPSLGFEKMIHPGGWDTLWPKLKMNDSGSIYVDVDSPKADDAPPGNGFLLGYKKTLDKPFTMYKNWNFSINYGIGYQTYSLASMGYGPAYYFWDETIEIGNMQINWYACVDKYDDLYPRCTVYLNNYSKELYSYQFSKSKSPLNSDTGSIQLSCVNGLLKVTSNYLKTTNTKTITVDDKIIVDHISSYVQTYNEGDYINDNSNWRSPSGYKRLSNIIY